MPERLPLAEIKAHLSEIVDRVERENDRIVLTRNGRPAAVIISTIDLEALEDTVELLSEAETQARIRVDQVQVPAGRVVSADELRAKYLQE